jgi:hypothetical protein
MDGRSYMVKAEGLFVKGEEGYDGLRMIFFQQFMVKIDRKSRRLTEADL